MGIKAHAQSALETHTWPGNVRDLENRVKRAVIMAEGPAVTAADLELTSPSASREGIGPKEAREALDRDLIQRAMARRKGNITQVANDLGISRPTLYGLLERLGIRQAKN